MKNSRKSLPKKIEKPKIPVKLRIAKILRRFFFLIVASGFISAIGLAILSGLAFSLDQTSPVVLTGDENMTFSGNVESTRSSWEIAMYYAPGYSKVISIISGICGIILVLWFLAGTAKFFRKLANFLVQKIALVWLADLLIVFTVFILLILALWLAASPESFLMYISRVTFIFILSVLILLISHQLAGEDFAKISD